MPRISNATGAPPQSMLPMTTSPSNRPSEANPRSRAWIVEAVPWSRCGRRFVAQGVRRGGDFPSLLDGIGDARSAVRGDHIHEIGYRPAQIRPAIECRQAKPDAIQAADVA